MKEREAEILKLLIANGRQNVSELAQNIGVSQVTIRKDLDSLETEGMIIREHGYARLNDSDDMSLRIAKNYELKQKIATKALEQIQDNETVLIESGSCCAILAREIARNRKNVTIITNSAFIADYVRSYNDVEVILLGGMYQKTSQVNVGPMTRQCLKTFYVDKAFIGIDGFSEKHGFTGNDFMRSEVVRDMLNQTEKVIVVTDSTKFGRHSQVFLIDPQDVSETITDSGIAPEYVTALREAGIKVEIVDSGSTSQS